MDHNNYQMFQSKLNKNNHFLKRTFQLVISVSAFSLFLCYSTGFSLFPHSFNVYFSTLLFSFVTHTLERRYMFLICNGILAFLAKSSVSNSSSTSSSSVSVNGGDHAFSASELYPMKEPVFKEEEEEEEEVKLPVTITPEEKQELEQEEQARECLIGEKETESHEVFNPGLDDGVETDQSVLIQEDDDDIGEAEAEAEDAAGGGGSEDIYSTDDLNKKIEEFIRKMKDEIRIEAQQHLITVE